MSTAALIASAYDLLAERWSDDQFRGSHGLVPLRRALAFLGSAADGWALNVGCGCNTRFNPVLRARGLRIEAIDVSARMVAMARAADPDVLLHQADICAWAPPRQYALILAWDSLWHVPLDQQQSVLLKLMSALQAGGVLLFTAGGLEGANEHTDATMGPSLYYATLGIPGLLQAISQGGCTCKHLEFDQFPERHLCVVAHRLG